MKYKYKKGIAVFAGGNHIFFIMGVLHALLKEGLSYDVLATYSAGSAIVGNILKNNLDEPLTYFKKLLKSNDKNLHIENLIKLNSSIFPHNSMYTDIVKHILNSKTICNSNKVVRIVATHYNNLFPRFTALMAMLSLLIYSKSKKSFGPNILKMTKQIFRLKPHIFSNSDFCSRDRAFNIIMGSSTIYPFIKLHTIDGNYQIDGKHSLISPIDLLDDCEHVLSLHAHYTWPTQRPNLTQLFPSRKVEVSPMDYTDADGIVSAFQQGIDDGNNFLKSNKNSVFVKD